MILKIAPKLRQKLHPNCAGFIKTKTPNSMGLFAPSKPRTNPQRAKPLPYTAIKRSPIAQELTGATIRSAL
ncbi:hypothetical protein AMR42_01815 [Limnothrix sp. PR1529]|nr:hypothetical protein BCR12_00690 [Limnothrix sp. P13C2]PIB15264.1 hypothetical protein AMR42_01815 [Limnothrix sp. PR1529]